MFGVESKELLIILFAALILFGPKRIPEVARALGKGVGDIRDALSGVERDVRHAADALTPPQTRPVPGVGAVPVAFPGESPAGRVRADGLPEGDGRVHTGDSAALIADAVTDPGGASVPKAEVAPLDRAVGGSQAVVGDRVTAQRPEPGAGPDLAG